MGCLSTKWPIGGDSGPHTAITAEEEDRAQVTFPHCENLISLDSQEQQSEADSGSGATDTMWRLITAISPSGRKWANCCSSAL